jgi:hypothetical protein
MAKQKDGKATEAASDIFSDVAPPETVDYVPPKEDRPAAREEPVTKKPVAKVGKTDKDAEALASGGWFERDGRWYCPPSLAYRDENGQMFVPAKDSHFTKEEALALEARRHRQPPLQ